MDQDINYNELFDLPEDTGEQTAGDVQDVTPADAATAAAPTEDADSTEAAQEDSKEQSLEERSRQAEYRRRREEREARIREQAKAEAYADVDETLTGLGMPNPKTGEIVDSYDKLKAYYARISNERVAKGKATAADIRRIAREELAGQPAQQTPAQQPAQAGPTEADFAAELAEIKRMDPEMTDLGAILRSEAGPKFRQYVNKGLNFVDAYTLAARDRIAQRQAGQAQEAARVKAAGKDHLSATQSRGQGAEPIPAEEMTMYRVFFPDASDAEIREMAAADKKRQGR